VFTQNSQILLPSAHDRMLRML